MTKNKLLVGGVILGLLAIVFYSLNTKQPHHELIAQERESYKKNMLAMEDSPIDVSTFSKFNYFESNEKWKVSAVLEKTTTNEAFRLLMTDGTSENIPLFGTATFEIDGKTQLLKVFDEEDHFMIPFLDETNKTETYGGGRYVNIEKSELNGDNLTIDFNLAHNFYCAYNENYICPIPPKENQLTLRVEAGEKKYKP